MSEINLSATGLVVNAPDNYHYHDDGTIKSLVAYATALSQKYSSKNIHPFYLRLAESIGIGSLFRKFAEEKGLPVTKGLNFQYYGIYSSIEDALKEDAEVHVHTFVLEGLGELETLFLRGHEETHTLLHLERLYPLEDALSQLNLKPKIKPDGLEQLPKEVICDVGGLYAVLWNCPNLTEFTLKGCSTKERLGVMNGWLKEHRGIGWLAPNREEEK